MRAILRLRSGFQIQVILYKFQIPVIRSFCSPVVIYGTPKANVFVPHVANTILPYFGLDLSLVSACVHNSISRTCHRQCRLRSLRRPSKLRAPAFLFKQLRIEWQSHVYKRQVFPKDLQLLHQVA